MPDCTIAVAQYIAVPRDVTANVATHVRMGKLAAQHDAQLVLFPELSLTAYDLTLRDEDAIHPDDSRLHPLRDLARSSAVTIVAGAPIASKNGLCIGAMIFHPDGSTTTHTKVHVHESELGAFVPGIGGPPLKIGAEVVSLAICADITHAEHALGAANCGATVYAAGCLISKRGYAKDAGFLQQYATEHQLLSLMSNYGADTAGYICAGSSAAWTASGLLASAPEAGEALLLITRADPGWQARSVTY